MESKLIETEVIEINFESHGSLCRRISPSMLPRTVQLQAALNQVYLPQGNSRDFICASFLALLQGLIHIGVEQLSLLQSSGIQRADG